MYNSLAFSNTILFRDILVGLDMTFAKNCPVEFITAFRNKKIYLFLLLQLFVNKRDFSEA